MPASSEFNIISSTLGPLQVYYVRRKGQSRGGYVAKTPEEAQALLYGIDIGFGNIIWGKWHAELS